MKSWFGSMKTVGISQRNTLIQYLWVIATFARNSFVREMIFRANFLLETFASTCWVFANIGFYLLVFYYTPSIGANTGWSRFEFFAFLATSLIVNSIVHTVFMPNADQLSERIRTGTLDFALVKPMDTQLLVSFERLDLSSAGNFTVGIILLSYSLFQMGWKFEILPALLYIFYVGCGVAILYSLMFSLAATTVWLGRNQTLYDFWFYLTTFGRYPMEIYRGRLGTPLGILFTYVIPILLVVNVPVRFLLKPLRPQQWQEWLLPVFAAIVTVTSLWICRQVFRAAIEAYRSASS
jgi:ABC-2 type transport system permease protein